MRTSHVQAVEGGTTPRLKHGVDCKDPLVPHPGRGDPKCVQQWQIAGAQTLTKLGSSVISDGISCRLPPGPVAARTTDRKVESSGTPLGLSKFDMTWRSVGGLCNPNSIIKESPGDKGEQEMAREGLGEVEAPEVPSQEQHRTRQGQVFQCRESPRCDDPVKPNSAFERQSVP